MSLENPNTLLAEWVSKNKAEKPVAEVPVEVQTAEPKSTEESDKPKAEEIPKEQPKEELTKTTSKVEDVSLAWDADEAPKTEKVSSVFDFNKLGSALELGDIKDESDFVSKVSQLKTKLKEIEDKPLSGIPDEFKEVIEVAKSGANWKDYLSNQLIDYNKVDPVQLFEDTFLDNAVKNPKYFTDGKFDEAKAMEALEAIQDPIREFEGRRIAEALSYNQRLKQQEQRAKAEAKLVQAEKSLSTATKNLNELLPFENYGIKFEPKHSSEIYNGIANSKLTKELLGVSYEDLVKSGADMKAVAKTIAAATYAEKMIKFKSQNAKVDAKKELLDKIQNPQINHTGSTVQPESEGKKVLTPTEILAQHYAKLNKSGL